MEQGVWPPILDEIDIKYVQHFKDDIYLAFPRWDRRIRRIAYLGKYGKYKKGVSIIREIEWTQGALPLIPQPEDRKKDEAWQIGKSGSEIFLSDFVEERSYVLWKTPEFNGFGYNPHLQVISSADGIQNKYKVFFVTFDQESQMDTLYESFFVLDVFESKYIRPSELRYYGSDYYNYEVEESKRKKLTEEEKEAARIELEAEEAAKKSSNPPTGSQRNTSNMNTLRSKTSNF